VILVVGASGRLGGTIAWHLLEQGERVRVLTRTPAKLENLKALGAEVVNVDLFRFKYQTEAYLRASGIPFTILRPTHLMDSWVDLFAQSILKKHEATIFGRGANPVNFVAIDDVARLAALVLKQPEARNWTVEIGGPENLTLQQVVEAFERVLHLHVKVRHLSVPTLRIIQLLARPFHPVLSRQLDMAILLDTDKKSCEMTETLKSFPLQLTRMEEFIQTRFASSLLQQSAMSEARRKVEVSHED
jgi:uncharacterized protein YbjT (DUF2867 family)